MVPRIVAVLKVAANPPPPFTLQWSSLLGKIKENKCFAWAFCFFCLREHFHLSKRAEGGRGGPCICRLSLQPKNAAGNFADWLSINQRGEKWISWCPSGWIEKQQTPNTSRQNIIFPPKLKVSIRKEGRTDGEIFRFIIDFSEIQKRASGLND